MPATSQGSAPGVALPRPRLICLGGAVIDRKLTALGAVRPGTSNPARMTTSFGGVARNVAENLARMGCAVTFLSCVGDDPDGAAMLAHLAEAGADVSGVEVIFGEPTAQYVAILEPGGALHVAASSMALLDRMYGPLVAGALASARAADWLFVDCNAPAATLAEILARAAQDGIALAVDAISTPKAQRLPADLAGLGCLFLNRDEAVAILGDAGDPGAMAQALAERGAARVVLTLGAEGALALEKRTSGLVHIPAEPAKVVDVTGAGDALIAGTLRGLCAGLTLPEAVRLGTHLAARTVACGFSVDAALSPALADGFIAGAVAKPSPRTP